MMTGIDVGHKFFSRAEMVVVGFFSHWLNGIDYIGQNGSKVIYYIGGISTATAFESWFIQTSIFFMTCGAWNFELCWSSVFI